MLHRRRPPAGAICIGLSVTREALRDHNAAVQLTQEVYRFDERQIVQRGTVCDDDHCLDGANAASLSLRTSSKERSRKTPWALRNPSISYRDSIPSSRRAWETVSFPERTPSSAMASNAARARPLASDASRRARSSGISKWMSIGASDPIIS